MLLLGAKIVLFFLIHLCYSQFSLNTNSSSIGRVNINGCGISSSCAGQPPACIYSSINGPACEYIVKYYRDGSVLRFSLEALRPSKKVAPRDNFYISVGYSTTPTMEDSLIVSCVYDDEDDELTSIIGGYSEWKKSPKKKTEVQNVIRNFKSSLNDDVLKCNFDLPLSLIVNPAKENEVEFNMEAEPGYILVARAYAAGECLGYHHKDKFVSTQVLLTSSPQNLLHYGTAQLDEMREKEESIAPSSKLIDQGPMPLSKCGTSSGCFGVPAACTSSNSVECELLAVYEAAANRINFELYAKPEAGSENAFYGALGMGLAPEMPNSYIVECVHDIGHENQFALYESKALSRSVPDKIDLEVVKDVSASLKDNVLICRFSFDKNDRLEPMGVTLGETPLHIHLARGAAQNLAITKHTLAQSSAQPLQLNETVIGESKSQLFIQLHAGLMVGAWMWLASFGVFIARYLKQWYAEREPCGVKMWFFFPSSNYGARMDAYNRCVCAYRI